MSKFDDIITKEDQELIQSVFINLDVLPSQKLNIIETLENMVFLHTDFFEKFTWKQKINTWLILATILDTLLDEEINPLARKYVLRAFDCFNNCIYDLSSMREELDYVQ